MTTKGDTEPITKWECDGCGAVVDAAVVAAEEAAILRDEDVTFHCDKFQGWIGRPDLN